MGYEDRGVPGAIVCWRPSVDIGILREGDSVGTFESEYGDFAVGRSTGEDRS